MNLEKISYADLLKYIDALRAQNITDNHPDMLKAKWKLREFLESRKKSTSLVPKLKTVKTITFAQAPESDQHKYVILGTALAAAILLYKLTGH